MAVGCGISQTAAATMYPKITEGDKPLARVAGAKFLRMEDDCAVLAVESGENHFASKLNR